MHAFGTGLGGIPANREGYGGPIVGDTIQVGAHDVDELEALFRARGSQIAAFIGEPVIGAGGVIPPDDGYWEAVTRLCDAHGILLVVDEVITGFGRLGTMFGSERFGIAPDMVTFAKGVTSGYLPLGGVLVGRRVQEPFWDGPAGPVFRHGYTYSGHATACAAALANLDILEREGLVGRAAALEPVLAREIARLAAVRDHRSGDPNAGGRARGRPGRGRRTGGRAPVNAGAAGPLPHSVPGSVRLDCRRAMAEVDARRAIKAAVLGRG